jgi:hypothetical protein
LNKTGFDCDDARMYVELKNALYFVLLITNFNSKKLFALAAQKFVADIATDAFQFNQIKQSSRTTSKSNKVKYHFYCIIWCSLLTYFFFFFYTGKENSINHGRFIIRLNRIWG